MKLSRNAAMRLWEQCFGDERFAKDFHGNLMCRDAYGDRDAYIVENGQEIYCGWNLHHILPKALGGSDAFSNLLCTNIITNDETEDKVTFWVDDNLYQVQKIRGQHEYDIVRLR